MKCKKLIAICMTAACFLSTGIIAAEAGNEPPASKIEASSEQCIPEREKKPAKTAETPKKNAVTREGSVGESYADGDFTVADGVLTKYSGNDIVVSVPEGVMSIGKDAFSSATGIEQIVLPASVTSIHDYAFDDCEKLEDFSVKSSNTKYAASDGVLYSKDYSTIIRYPRGRTATSFSLPSRHSVTRP